jgi:hypothetical protein
MAVATVATMIVEAKPMYGASKANLSTGTIMPPTPGGGGGGGASVKRKTAFKV